MEILEHRDAWTAEFAQGWKRHLDDSGEVDWKLYRYVRNRSVDAAPGVDPAQAKLLLVTTAGAHLREGQTPFDAANDHGDYSVRTFPVETPYDALDYSHDHYDHTARREDPRVNLPLADLRKAVEEGRLGGLAETVVSFAGYQPDAGAVVERVVPEVLRVAEATGATAALLVPV